MAGASKRNEQIGAFQVISRVQRAWGESPFYQAKLKGPAPDRLLAHPSDPFTPGKELASALARGRLVMGDETLDCEDDIASAWDAVDEGGPLYAFLQEFAWLRHLAVLQDAGRDIAKTLTGAWLDRFEKWAPQAWEPYTASERLIQLCAHNRFILLKSDALWRSRVLNSMARQTRHLARTAHRAETGFDRLMTALGLCAAGYCLPGCEGPAERGLEMARRELRLQLRADGGHVSRNPSRQLKLAVRLQFVMQAIEGRGAQPPGFLRHAAMRTGAMAMFFRCADGRLAVFNGGYEDDARALLAVQQALDPDSAPSDFARHSGYHKLKAGRAQVIVDSGDDLSPSAFKSASSIHFSSGRSRVVVNCGNGGHRAQEWRRALSRRAAHSALSIDGANVSFGAVTHRRAEDGKGQLIEIERPLTISNGEQAIYMRRLFLAAGGANLRGEELISEASEALVAAASWRFHLHPAVRASLARDKRSVILLAPNKEGWRFKSNCPELLLEKSVYCGEGGAPVATEQIVLSGGVYDLPDSDNLVVKWAFQRLDPV